VDIFAVKRSDESVIQPVHHLVRHFIPQVLDLLHDPDFRFVDLVISHHFGEMTGGLDSIIRLFVKKIEETGFFRKKESKCHGTPLC